MTLLALLLLAVLAMAPLGITLRWGTLLRSRRESALAVHRGRLAELDRDRAEGRVAEADYQLAVLEVQRRLLAAADAPEEAPRVAGGRRPLWAALVVVPLAALGLYLIDGHPELPAAPLAARLARADAERVDAAGLVGTLRARLATLDPKTDLARQGYLLLGNTEDALGHLPEATAAWRVALAARFDPTLAAQVAEAQTRIDGHVSAESAALFRQALAAAPAEAAWRGLAERRLGEMK